MRSMVFTRLIIGEYFPFVLKWMLAHNHALFSTGWELRSFVSGYTIMVSVDVYFKMRSKLVAPEFLDCFPVRFSKSVKKWSLGHLFWGEAISWCKLGNARLKLKLRHHALVARLL